MFNPHSFLDEIHPDDDFRLGSAHLDHRDVIMQHFGNSMVDDHQELGNLSIPQICLNDLRSSSPEHRMSSYDHIFDNPQGLLSPKMGCSHHFGL